jgi:bla regulator protein BlaR1
MPALTNHLWQSTLFAIVAALLTLAFRKNQAKVRYWLWLGASVKFFIPFSLLIAVGSHFEWAQWRGPMACAVFGCAGHGPAPLVTIEQISEPFSQAETPTRSMAAPIDWLPVAILAVWVCGFLAIVLIRLRAWLRIRDAVRASTPVAIPAAVEVRLSQGLIEPGVVGLFHPILLLPEGIVERLTPSQLEAVLAHELCHIRRRDNLWALLHMMVEALFWFHPLVWWIGARLVEERERACDEEVLSLGNQASVYADAILHVCKLYLESPLACVSGVAGSDVRRRIEAIMSNRGVQGLNRAKKFLLVAAGMAAVLSPVMIGLVMGLGHASAARAQSTAQQSPTAAVQSFDVASIKPCAPGEGGGRGRNRGGGSPGRLSENCVTVSNLIRQAFVEFADGRQNFLSSVPIEGGPAWINSETYTIEATAESAPNQSMMRGPMLQTLLNQRFNLKVHSESKQVPVYTLSVAKGGPKFQPTMEGSCVPVDTTLSPPYPQFCGQPKRGDPGLHLIGATMSDLCKILSAPEISDRPVIDKTGLPGMFDVQLPTIGELRGASGGTVLEARGEPGGITAVDPAPPGDSPFDGMRAAIEKLGLNLTPAKGPGKLLVIDHVERPTEN